MHNSAVKKKKKNIYICISQIHLFCWAVQYPLRTAQKCQFHALHISSYYLNAKPISVQVSALEQERSSLTAQLQREQTRVQELHAQHESVMDKSQKLQRELRETQQSLLQVIVFMCFL